MQQTIKNIKKVYQYGKSQKLNLILEVVGSIIGIILSIILPILSAKLIVYITDNLWIQVVSISSIILILNIISHLKTVLIRKNTQQFTKAVTENIQKQLGVEILKINQTNLDKHSSGTFIKRMTTDTQQMSDMFTVGIGHLTGVISSIGIFVAIFLINKYVFLYYLIVTTTLTYLHFIKSKKVQAKDKVDRHQSDKVTGLIGELIRGTRDIKMLNAKNSFLNNLNINIIEKNKHHIAMRNVDIFYNCLIGIISSIFEFLLMLLLFYLIYNKTITVAIALALHSYRVNVMINFMDKISLLLESLNNFNLSCERVFAILENKTFVKETFGKKHLTRINGNFEFQNVTFSYIENQPLIKNLSFQVKANSTVAFVGKSGAGKTTIFNLLCKMYNVDSGTIKIDGIDIKDLDEESIRGNITIIGQSPYIFNMSIKDNLKLVKADLTDEEMIEACRIACLEEFINNLSEKYDTIIGEGGVNLSGGQKQRLAIARALVQKTEIILFDEATSALDNETQAQIKHAIDNLKKDYTILIIAHRLSTIMNCDKIMLLDDGKIIAEGTHKELLKHNKNYQKLCSQELLD